MLVSIKLAALTFIIMCILPAAASHALVNLADTETTGFRSDVDNNVTQVEVSSGSGLPGDFEVLICSTVSDGSNSFLDPAPDIWSAIDTGDCAGGICILGIFGRFDQSPDSSAITCNWTEPTSAVAALSFRYRGVDGDNPVLDVQCSVGNADDQLIIPSVNTEPGSAVLLAYTFGFNPNSTKGSPGINESLAADPIFQGGNAAVGQELSQPQEVITAGQSLIYRSGGPTGDFNFGIAGLEWRACAISLSPGPVNIPALSEWGLGAFAVLFGIAAVWALRRQAARVYRK